MFTDIQVANLESSMHENFPETIDMYIDEIIFCPNTRLYYVAMKPENRIGIAEYCVELDFHATYAPTAKEIVCPFHRNDFAIVEYQYR